MRGLFVGLVVCLTGCAGAVEPPKVPVNPPVVSVDRQIVTPDDGATAKELLRRGELALREQRWQEAAKAL